MGVHVAFLRAINLGAKRKFAKDDIARATTAAGFTGVATHINTGNVRLETSMRSHARIEEALEAAYLADRGFEVPTMVFSAADLARVVADADELAAGRVLARHYVHFLKQEPTEAALAAIAAAANEKGEMVVRGRVAHALLGPGYRAGVVDPLNAARHLGVSTARALTVVRAVTEKWC